MESATNNSDNNQVKKTEKQRENLNLSESLKLKKLNQKEINNNNKNNIQDPINIPDLMNKEKIRQIEEKDKILNYIKDSEFFIDSKKYSNSVIIGSFCYSLAFVSFGIYKSRIITDEYTNVWSALATYGGLGQITAGLLELNKKRQFSSFLYIIYGIYCLTHYLLRILTDRFGEKDLCMFFLTFFLMTIPAVIYSLKINLFFLIQTSFGSLYFFFSCIGEGIPEDVLSEQVSGIMQIISGVCSFYIFLSQMFNSVNSNIYLPTFPFDVNNNIDIIRKEKKE